MCGNATQKTYLLALSGGVDSMVLAHLFLTLSKAYPEIEFHAAHVNFGLRGLDSQADQQLVENFCRHNHIPLHLYQVQESEKPENSIQIWARELRYSFFRKILKEQHLDFLVTAHHADDNTETFFINLSRGSGIRGLSGIPAAENHILRPLLGFSKKQIYGYAEQNLLMFREDASNGKNDYLRNRFRNIIIPDIEREISGFGEALKQTQQHLRHAADFIAVETERSFQALVLWQNASETVLDRRKLLALHPFLATEILLKFGVRGEEMHKVIKAENGKMFRSKTHEIRITRNELVCTVRTALKS